MNGDSCAPAGSQIPRNTGGSARQHFLNTPMTSSTLDSHQLNVFVVLSRHLNMSRTAAELGLTPSGISHCLKTLETDLGCRLCERTSRKVMLTRAGHEFLREAEAILEQMNQARTKLRSWLDWRRGQLRIAASITACQYILPAALREFRESFPEFTIQIDPCSAQQAMERIAGDQVDLGVFIQPTHCPGLTFVPIAEDELQFLVNPIHPWALKGKASHQEISSQNLILPERASETHALIEAYFRREGVRIRPFIEIGNEEAIKQFVRLDLGVGLLPKWIAAAEIKQQSLVYLPLGRKRLRRHWGILHNRSRKLGFAESVFVDLCRNVSRELMPGTKP